jgi:uncharacterized protein with HEPN domain
VSRRGGALSAPNLRGGKEARGYYRGNSAAQPWADIRALGNIIRHEYDAIDPAVIWKIVEDDLLPLEKAVEAAIKKLEHER